MKWLKRIFNFYINSSIHVSLAVVSLVFITYETFNILYHKEFIFFVFFASITGYNFIKYSRLAKLHHLSLTESLRAIQLFSLLSFVCMIYYAMQLSYDVLFVCGVFGLLTLLYALPVLSRKRNLRSFHGAKMYTIAIVWSGVTVLLPAIDGMLELQVDVWITFVQRLLFIIVITLPFDIRDLNYDREEINTIPKSLGIKYTKLLGIGLLILFFILEFFKDQLQYKNVFSICLISVLSAICLLASSDKQYKYYASFFVEGLPMIWFGILSLLYALLP
ncbi:hypothetical protein GCM10011344_31710 [Dokdonia pacifica]|uniref:UbiA prenyltransferase family protein n=1 Tax=Dokdonia pacifica TaxID=1627892 RepID=A0A239BN95_9FLAO|nr:hypothetical protein GCM10011344_31710 [Dokdonia pacifica]SNS09082.1 hypothetical protein SAMN06265376_106298 [Dokdonia pacifica]